MKNTKNFSDTKPHRTLLKLNQLFSQLKESQKPRTGDPSELLTLLKTKLNVDHAGLSLLPLLWRVLKRFKKVVPFSPFLNNNLFPAIPDATDVVVDGNPTVCNTLSNTVKLPSLSTHILPDTDNLDLANHLKLVNHLFMFLKSTPFKDTLLSNSLLPLLKDQSP